MHLDRTTTIAVVHAPTRTTRIVVGFDGSTSARAALEVAVARAGALDVPLVLVCAVEDGDALSQSPAFAQLAADLLADTAAALVRERGVSVTTELQLGSAAAALVAIARPGDLLVVGTHGHRPVARVLLGSTSTSLVTHAHQPVLVVRSGPVTADAPVVVGVDGSTSALPAVTAAAAEADRTGATLRAVVAVPSYVDVLGFTTAPDAAEVEGAAAFLSEALAGVHENYPDLVVQQVVSRSHPVEALVRESRRARLVVLGSRGLGTFRSLLLGSVSRELVQRAETSVLVVRPSSRAEVPQRVGAGRGTG